MTLRRNDGRLEIVQGDIADQDTEAIVNAANNHFWMGSGVAGAIKRKGGDTIEREAVAQGPVEVGGAVITSGGSLKARFVIHAAAMGQDLRTDAKKIRAAVRNSLQLAEKKRIATISFPAIGTGVGGFPVSECAEIMVAEAKEHTRHARQPTLIRFVLFDKQSFDAFQKILEEGNLLHRNF